MGKGVDMGDGKEEKKVGEVGVCGEMGSRCEGVRWAGRARLGWRSV